MPIMQSNIPSGVLVCPRCGIHNPKGSKQCLNCGTRLDGKAGTNAPLALRPTQEITPPPPILVEEFEPRINPRGKIYYPPQKHTDFLPGRPGLVTLYIVWQLISLVTGLWDSPLFILRVTTADLRDLNLSGNVFSLVFLGFLNLAFLGSLVGLWYMKNWARVVQILFLLLSIILEVALLVTSIGQFTSDDFFSMELPRLILFAVPLWWFVISHRQFRDAAPAK